MNESASDSPRPGTYADLSRRMDRLELAHEDLTKDVGALKATIARIELNQDHSTELNKLRFDALDTGMRSLGSQLTDFIKRIEGIISGEIETTASRQGRTVVADYQEWRETVETRFDEVSTAVTQGKLLVRIGVLLVSSNLAAIIVAIYAAVNAAGQ